MISGLVLKYLNGECFVIRRGYETTLPVSSSFCLTVPAAQQTPDKDWIRVADRHPTLYLGAADDVISPPPNLAALRETIGPKADSVVVQNAGHALLPEQPEAVAQALLEWVASLSPKRP